MNIQLIREENGLDALLSIRLDYEDIQENAEKNLHTAKQKMNLPGFRKGKIPVSIAKNYLWEGIIRDELEKKLEESINDYFKTNEIDFLKPLLPIETDEQIDLKNFSGHEFKYEVGLINKFEVEPLDLLKGLKLYDIQIGETEINEEIAKIQDSYGEFIQPELVENNPEMRIYAEFSELNQDHEMMEEGLKQKISKKLNEIPEKLSLVLIGKKKEETFDINIDEIFDSREALADFLKIEKLTAEDLSAIFRITVLSIYLHTKAELNEVLFKKFTEGKASNYEEFVAELSKMIKDSYKRNSENKVFDEIYETLLKEVNCKLPEKFTDKLFEKQHEEHSKEHEHTEDQLSEEKTAFIKQMQWSVITDYLAKKTGLEATEQDIIREAYIYISSMYLQYGIRDIQPEKISQTIREFLKNPDNALMMKERFLSGKVLENIKNDLNLTPIEISLEEYKKLNLAD